MVGRLHRSIVRELWRVRGQVVAAGLVVACGIAAFVTMSSTYLSLKAARSDYFTEYRFADVFAHLKRAPEPLGSRLSSVRGVSAVELRLVEDVMLSVPSLAEPATGRFNSLPAGSSPAMNALSLRQGRFPASSAPDEIVISETFARANRLRPGDHIGAILNGRWKPLTIVGLALSPEYVYEVGPGMVFPDNRLFGVMWMKGEILGDAFNMRGAFNDVAIKLAHGASEAYVIDAADTLLAPYGGTGAYGRIDQASNRFLSDELAEIRVSATLIPAIFLSVSCFLLYTLLARLVSIERTQIGLLKAFGYSNARIGAHFLEFGLLIVLIGLVLGTLAGARLGAATVGLYRIYFHFPSLPYRFPTAVLVWAAVIALGAAAAGSLAAVRRATRLAPAEAMWPEPPGKFRPGLLESLGIVRVLGPGARVVARNLSRRPWRAAMSITAIAFAVATVVLGRFTFDAVNHLVAVHFGFAQRGDVTVLFREPSARSALYEIARLPGVLRAEPFRTTPVWLRFGHRSKRAVIQGVSPDMEVDQIVDTGRHRLSVPPDGLVITRKLAQGLGASPGDVIIVSQLEGRRATFERPLLKLSDEPLGVSAYMDSGALARLIGEDADISGAHLRIDRAKEAVLYESLKRIPAVTAVAVRSAMLRTIHEVMMRSFIVMTIVMTAFAAVLVMGVVYNSGRIALSERAHELASLRVLGFSRREVTGLLLGEQTFLTVMAIPAGLALGAAASRALVPAFERDLFRLPFVLNAETFAFAALVTLAAAGFSALLVGSRIAGLDLIAVLKSRE